MSVAVAMTSMHMQFWHLILQTVRYFRQYRFLCSEEFDAEDAQEEFTTEDVQDAFAAEAQRAKPMFL